MLPAWRVLPARASKRRTRSPVSGCVENRTDQLVIDAVVRMAEGLSKDTVAEFTGDRETAEFLQRAGVKCGQGFYLGRPVPIANVLSSDSRPGVSTRR